MVVDVVIYKYEIPLAGFFNIEMPEYARVISIQMQDDKPMMWVLCDEERPLKTRHFMVVGTGQKIPENIDPDFSDYIGTIQMLDGKLVWHIFDLYGGEGLQ